MYSELRPDRVPHVEDSRETHKPLRLQEVIEQRLYPESSLRALQIISDMYPELKDTWIQPEFGKNASLGSYEFMEGSDGLPQPVIRMAADGVERYSKLHGDMQASIRKHEDDLGFSPGTFSPELFQVFIFLHEFGHLYDWKVNYLPQMENPWDAVDFMKADRIDSLYFLPVRGEEPGFIINAMKKGKTLSDFSDRFPSIQEHPRFQEMHTVEDLSVIQQLEYRETPPERYADEFASRILRTHLEKILPSQTLNQAA